MARVTSLTAMPIKSINTSQTANDRNTGYAGRNTCITGFIDLVKVVGTTSNADRGIRADYENEMSSLALITDIY